MNQNQWEGLQATQKFIGTWIRNIEDLQFIIKCVKYFINQGTYYIGPREKPGEMSTPTPL